MQGHDQIPGRRREEPGHRNGLFRLLTVEGLVVFLLVPLLLLVLQGGWRGPHLGRLLASRYLQNFIVGLCIAGTLRVLYRAVWPRLITRPPSPALRLVAHATTVVVGVAAGGEVASRIIALGWDVPLTHVRFTVMRLGLFASMSIVAISVVYGRLRAQAQRLQVREELAQLAAVQA